MNNFFIKFLVIILCMGTCQNTISQEYPFELPKNITATLNVETTTTEKFKNRLLGYNIEGFETKQEKDFIQKFDPISIRFPHGVFANYYNWRTDGYQKDSYDSGGLDGTISNYVKLGLKGHIDGIKQLNDARKINKGKGFNMMWTYSMNFDNASSNVARAKQDIKRGFQVEDIELGNEFFWKSQRSNQLKNEADYVRRAKTVSAALRKEIPNVRLSIPLSWRRNHDKYNKLLTTDTSYFDAISVHVYTGADPDKPEESNTAYSKLLTARLNLANNINWIRNNFAKKPVWLTEWGVSGGKQVRAAACLGMADVYLMMAENQNIYDRANWFSFNRVLNAMVEVGPNRKPIYPLQKRGYLSTYEILYDVFKDGTMLKSSMNTIKLNGPDGKTNAVNGRVVTKNGKTAAIAVNLTNKPVEFVLKIDGTTYRNSFKHEALVFSNLGVVQSIPVNSDPKKLIKEGSGKITLPPLSISIISDLKIDQNPPVAQTPFKKWAIKIPGVIEAEDFDNGGQYVSFYDTTKENIGGAYRKYPAVDIGKIPTGGYHVGWMKKGEWLEYTVRIPNQGKYNFTFHYATINDNAAISAALPDSNLQLFSNVSLPKTGNWEKFTTRTKYQVILPRGLHVLRIKIVGSGINLDKIEIREPLVKANDFKEKPKIYPNPVTDSFTMDIGVIGSTASINVYDITGKNIFTKSILDSQITIDTKNKFTPGVYIVKVFIDKTGQSFIQKLVIE